MTNSHLRRHVQIYFPSRSIQACRARYCSIKQKSNTGSGFDNPKFWTEEDLASLRHYQSLGMSIPEIASAMRRSVPSIRCKVNARKVSRPPAHAPWTTEDDDILRRMRRQGVPYKKIVGMLSVPRTIKSLTEHWYYLPTAIRDA